VDLNTQQPKVIQAILAGAYRDELGVSGTLASTEVAAIANALVTRTSGTGPAVTGKGPLANVADLVGRYSSGFTNPNGQPFAGFTDDFLQSTPLYSGASTAANNVDQRFLETAVRALSDTGMAGTWNLLIDIVAQTGRYPASTTSLANFMVEGERHYWVHMAIDRQNGAVIDQQIEEVNE
jgi:hypothetical protein